MGSAEDGGEGSSGGGVPNTLPTECAATGSVPTELCILRISSTKGSNSSMRDSWWPKSCAIFAGDPRYCFPGDEGVVVLSLARERGVTDGCRMTSLASKPSIMLLLDLCLLLFLRLRRRDRDRIDFPPRLRFFFPPLPVFSRDLWGLEDSTFRVVCTVLNSKCEYVLASATCHFSSSFFPFPLRFFFLVTCTTSRVSIKEFPSISTCFPSDGFLLGLFPTHFSRPSAGVCAPWLRRVSWGGVTDACASECFVDAPLVPFLPAMAFAS